MLLRVNMYVNNNLLSFYPFLLPQSDWVFTVRFHFFAVFTGFYRQHILLILSTTYFTGFYRQHILLDFIDNIFY